ncbi:MAG: Flp pilus assembly protein CpaB [Hyphomonadaceae bacterium]
MSARQLIVLAVAAIAAIGALLLIRGMGSGQAEPAEATAQIGGVEVLVAARDLPQGAALAPSDLAVRVFPEDTVSSQFVSITAQPAAQSEYVGAVTRRTFVQGEPIIMGSVLQPDGRGFLAAQLDPGFRAISIEVDASTFAGGYIGPNDRVDVIMTARDESGGNNAMRSDIVLEDIRVLAIDDAMQPQTAGEAPTRAAAPQVAVLELSAPDARTLALADAMGDITLALRGVEMEMVGQRQPAAQRGLSQSVGPIRVHAFGTVSGGDS